MLGNERNAHGDHFCLTVGAMPHLTLCPNASWCLTLIELWYRGLVLTLYCTNFISTRNRPVKSAKTRHNENMQKDCHITEWWWKRKTRRPPDTSVYAAYVGKPFCLSFLSFFDRKVVFVHTLNPCLVSVLFTSPPPIDITVFPWIDPPFVYWTRQRVASPKYMYSIICNSSPLWIVASPIACK